MRPYQITTITAALLAASAWAQPPSPEVPSPGQANEEQQAPPPQNNGGWRRASEIQAAERSPGQITIPAGSWIKIRVDQPLSSDRNQPGDSFTGSLAQPIVADGFVVAQRGQTIEGRVTEAIKAGRTKGTSRLGFELTEIALVDGQQMPVRTQLIEYNGGTSVGRDVSAIGVTTGTGAAIGAAAAGGFGAGMGAIAGAVASGIGVLATRGRATEIYPETVVTFRTLAPITINTDRATQAFQPVRQNDYQRQTLERRPAPQTQPSLNYPAYNPYFYGGPGGYSYGVGFGYPYYWGGSYFAPRVFIGGGGYYGHGHGHGGGGRHR